MTSERLLLGAHLGQQNLGMEELRALWCHLDQAGLDWISLWDHLYEAPNQGGVLPHFEAVASLAALACDTTNARLGCLVFYVGFRNPGLLARAAVTIDHLSGGRFELGLGAGWHQWEAEANGYDFPSVGTRIDMLDEATQMIKALLTQDRTDFAGRHYRAVNASLVPKPVNHHLPTWIGGRGEKKTLRIAARRADGWNAAYVSAEEFRHLNGVLDHWCEVEGRDPATIERSVNLLFELGSDSTDVARRAVEFTRQWGAGADRVRQGALVGTPDRAAEQVLAYRDAGADLVNVALRAPVDADLLDAYLFDVVPELRIA
jgi:alkanesulfonate monooxygenase SsuD/methylene tetrahydromethanopterin reductase-like flavin-dependent oxidoreductase (luciferase family)